MLELVKTVKNHIEGRIREMIAVTLVDLRKLDYIHDSKDQRIFLSGKLAAYEEMQKLIEERYSDQTH